ncbi:hypothetical protein [Spirosoma litoris]
MPNFSIDQARELVQDTINNGTRHAGYQRTVDLREDYLTILTGKNWQRFLSRFRLRTDLEEYQQQLELTHQNLSSTSSLLEKKFGQISRIQDIKRGLNFEGTSNRDQQDLQDVLNDFGGEGSAQRGTLEDYITLIYDRMVLYDPNAFILYDFAPFNALLGERARPYGIVFPCQNVLNFRHTRGDLDYLLVQVFVDYKDPDGIAKVATDYICCAGPFTVRYYEGADGRQDLPQVYEEFKAKSEKLYRIALFSPGVKKVPAVRLGYILDIETDNQTCVSPAFHSALDLFRELIDLKSLNDIVTKKHGWPQRFKQTPPCPGEMNPETKFRDGCNDGTNTRTGETCKECGGTGHITHKSEQDTITVDLPDNPEDWPDLSKLVYTVQPELETITTFDEKIENKKIEIIKTVFSSDQQVQVQSPAKTATEYVVSREDQNNTLLPCADQKALVIKTSILHVAALMNISGIVKPLYEYNRDLKLNSADEILDKIADKTSKVSSTTLEQIYDDYYQKVYAADEIALEWYYFLKAHIPFYLTPNEEFETNVASGYITDSDRTRRIYCDTIVADLRMTAPNILQLSYPEQETKITEIVDKILAELPKTVSLTNIPTPQQQQA